MLLGSASKETWALQMVSDAAKAAVAMNQRVSFITSDGCVASGVGATLLNRFLRYAKVMLFSA